MKQTKVIERLSSLTLLKIMLITGSFPWVLIDTGVVLFHLLSGDFVVNYQSGRGGRCRSTGNFAGELRSVFIPLHSCRRHFVHGPDVGALRVFYVAFVKVY